ncbi:hypothetical protein NQ314_012557 [Rhamnusium bicolor]|uniref:Uncharacterized protein n=1 Tax=Rhamnusium bicolor TaxID=1586634 RepID=A0AAV8XBZ6_9CUCU|nr:hypothetical protein NQ314_012557 [Rhamnusium bicolor]
MIPLVKLYITKLCEFLLKILSHHDLAYWLQTCSTINTNYNVTKKETITLHNEREQEKSPKNDVELCLEVEMDDEVREIITSPDKCMSTLLDVTVIKPKDIDIDQIYTTQKKILNGEEVRKLITLMELEKQDKQKLINQILSKEDRVVSIHRHNSNPKSAGDYIKNKLFERPEKNTLTKHKHYLDNRDSALFFEHIQKISSTDDTNSDICSDHKQHMYKHSMKSGDHERIQQIYTTPRTYNDIKSIFTCKNKHRYEQNEKPNKPCLCQNCAIVGVLTDSQKKAFYNRKLIRS